MAVLGLLRTPPSAKLATEMEVLTLIDAQHVAGVGIGFVDVYLLATARLPGAGLDARRAESAYSSEVPLDLETQILTIVNGKAAGERPTTISDLARQFGASSALVSGCAAGLVSRNLAVATMVDVRGVPKLHGLLPVQS